MTLWLLVSFIQNFQTCLEIPAVYADMLVWFCVSFPMFTNGMLAFSGVLQSPAVTLPY